MSGNSSERADLSLAHRLATAGEELYEEGRWALAADKFETMMKNGVASGEPNGQYVAGPHGVGDSVAPGQNAPAGHGPEQAEELWSATTSAP